MTLVETAIPLILKALWLSARWAGILRVDALKSAARRGDPQAEILFLHDRVAQLEVELDLARRRRDKPGGRLRYSLKERLLVLWFMEYFQVPRRHVTRRLGIARSTLYRWLKDVEGQESDGREPANKTPKEIVTLVLEIAKANPHWGRIRISMQVALLNVFLAASTVRNILQRPYPPGEASTASNPTVDHDDEASRPIPAWYPNHVWSVDRTIVLRWGLWPTYVLVAIDHYSRKIVCVTPLEGPNAGWTIDALSQAFEDFGSPKHVITDQEPLFKSAAFADLLDTWHAKHRFGAVGKHGSIAVTERAIKTLKYEWLFRVPLIKNFDHLAELCRSFSDWYNDWRPHMTLDGSRPNDVFSSQAKERPRRNDKTIPPSIARRHFHEVRMTGYRLQQAA